VSIAKAVARHAVPKELPPDGEERLPDAVARPVSNSTAFDDTVFTVPEIIVESTHVPLEEEDLFRRPGFVAVLDLGERRNRVDDLSTILSTMVGIRVRQYGGLGSYATVSIRGSSSNQVQLYLDGVPLNDAYMGSTNLADLPLDGIERVEVFRGSSPAHLGSSAIGGAVNLVTRDLAAGLDHRLATRLEAHTSYGSFGSARHMASLWSERGRVRLFLHGGYMASDGDFAFIDDQSTEENTPDDEATHRTNNDFAAWSFLGRLTTDLPVLGSVSVNQNTLIREGGVPGVGSDQSETARSERIRHITYATLQPPQLIGRRLRPVLAGFVSTANERFHDPNREIGLSRQDTDNTITTYGGNLRTRFHEPRLPAALDLFLEGRKERFHPETQIPVPTEGPDRTRRVSALTISGDVFLHRLNVVLTAAERFERHTSEFYDPPRFPWLPPTPQGRIRRDQRTPQFGFRWHVTSYATLKGNWGRYYRLPTFFELFGNIGSVTGNAGLEPEQGLNRDIGIIVSRDRLWGVRRLVFEAIYLNNEVENQILFFPNSQSTSRPENIGSARIRGWELSLSGLIHETFQVSMNFTHLESRDTGEITYYNGNRLPVTPENDMALALGIVRPLWSATYEFHYIGKNFLDPANYRETAAREIHNIAIELEPIRRGFSFTIEGKNLGNKRISDVQGFPLPGRSYFATLSYRP
jgi:iron complex outermembrane receptor protein